MNIDKLAESIWEASPGTLPWREVPTGSVTKGHYRRMAEAAVAAMELTREQGVRFNHASEILPLRDGTTYDDYGSNWEPLARWVGPWQKDGEQ